MKTLARWLAVIAGLVSGTAVAEVGDPTVRTDHPQYAGEGAFQSVEDCVRFAVTDTDGAQERAIALYRWLLTHQYHLASPQEWLVPGVVPDTARDNQSELIVYDANRSRFSYGYGLCGTVHAWNEPYWKALGMAARRRAFPGHTNSEIEYDGTWHAFDTDMAGLVFRKDGVVAGYEDVAAHPELAKLPNRVGRLPCYPFAWPGDFRVMQQGWAQVAKGGNWYRMYNSGYAAHPGVVHLRAGETFTRYFDRDHFGGPSRRRFWHHGAGGPFRNWTYVNMGEPRHDGAQANALGNASYGNAEFVYHPPLTDGRDREGIVAQSDNLTHAAASPYLRSGDGRPATVEFAHFSPYVICGDPADDANPMTGPATGGLIVRGRAVGEVVLDVSTDDGQTWIGGAGVRGTFEVDLTNSVKGRYGWRVRFTFSGGDGLEDLTFLTVAQMNQSIYPRLTPDGCAVTYRAGSRGVIAVLPNFVLPKTAVGVFEETALRSSNIAYIPKGPKQRLAYRTTNNKPATVVFRIASPKDAPLHEIRAAVQYQIRVPPPKNCDFHLDVSTDGGRSWREFARAEIPEDNEYSSGWLAGRATLADADVRTALVRVHLYADGYPTGLLNAQLYGLYATAAPQAATLTYGWTENGTAKQHTEQLPAGTTEATFRVPTGPAVRDDFVRVAVP